MWAALGLAMLGRVMRVDYRTWKQPALIWAALGSVLSRWIAVLFSAPINGTRRWFGIGGFGVQPSEVAKLAVIFFTAALLERRMNRIDDLRYSLVPLGIVIGAVTALVLLEPDFGTAASLVARRRGDGVRGGAQLALRRRIRRACWCRRRRYVLMSADYRVKRLTRSCARSATRWAPGSSCCSR